MTMYGPLVVLADVVDRDGVRLPGQAGGRQGLARESLAHRGVL